MSGTFLGEGCHHPMTPCGERRVRPAMRESAVVELLGGPRREKTTPSAGEDVGQLQLSLSAGGNAECCSPGRREPGGF